MATVTVTYSSTLEEIAHSSNSNCPADLHGSIPSISSVEFCSNTSPPLNGINQLNLTFDQVSYSVRDGLFQRGKKKILSDVRGDFRCGELSAIMGPSGAGKSTLLDILAGFTKSGVSGEVFINGKLRNLAAFRRSSAYIMQDDILQPLLTVQEAMQVAAELKLESDIPYADKQRGVDLILKGIGLDRVRMTLTKDLSGGEKKRLAIALELIGNPPIMFLDEPTSGLDCVSAKQCVDLLKSLASKKRTIICTIHQPSATLLDMMDYLYVVAKGHCVYAGAPCNLISYMQKLGYQCPTYHNPADFFLEVITIEDGNNFFQLTDAWETECKNNDWRISTGAKKRPFKTSDLAPVLPFTSKQIYDSESKGSAYYATSSWKQLRVLLWRSAIQLSRDKILTLLRLVVHLGLAVIIGCFYYGMGQEGSHTRDNFNLIFVSVFLLVVLAFDATIISFPPELPSMIREHFNRWYKLHSFFLANKLSDLPVEIATTFVYAAIIYEMTDQIQEFQRFLMFYLVNIIMTLIARVVALIMSTTLNVQNAVIFGKTIIMIPMLLSGFFVHLKDLQPYLHGLIHSSFVKYGLESATIAIYGYDRPRMRCNKDYCHFASPRTLLKEVDMEHTNYWMSISVLIGFYVFLDVLFYFALRLELRLRIHR